MPDPCRCGLCCEVFLIEATPADAEREPLIAQVGAIIQGQQFVDGEAVQTNEVAGYVLNRGAVAGGPCLFLSRDAEGRGVCGIYETRPDVCRRFDCEGDGRRQLVALGYVS